MELDSFYFGCIAPFPGDTDGTTIVSGCTISVIGSTSSPLYGIQNLGSYSFNVNYTAVENGIPAKMQQVKLNQIAGDFHFIITDAAYGSELYLDSFVIVQSNNSCSGDTSTAEVAKTLKAGPQNL